MSNVQHRKRRPVEIEEESVKLSKDIKLERENYRGNETGEFIQEHKWKIKCGERGLGSLLKCISYKLMWTLQWH